LDDPADADGVGDGDEALLFSAIDGDGSADSVALRDLRTFSSMSPITINDGSTIY
jgi:hypothetical protein